MECGSVEGQLRFRGGCTTTGELLGASLMEGNGSVTLGTEVVLKADVFNRVATRLKLDRLLKRRTVWLSHRLEQNNFWL